MRFQAWKMGDMWHVVDISYATGLVSVASFHENEPEAESACRDMADWLSKMPTSPRLGAD